MILRNIYLFNVILKLNGTHGYVYCINWAVNMQLKNSHFIYCTTWYQFESLQYEMNIYRVT